RDHPAHPISYWHLLRGHFPRLRRLGALLPSTWSSTSEPGAQRTDRIRSSGARVLAESRLGLELLLDRAFHRPGERHSFAAHEPFAVDRLCLDSLFPRSSGPRFLANCLGGH